MLSCKHGKYYLNNRLHSVTFESVQVICWDPQLAYTSLRNTHTHTRYCIHVSTSHLPRSPQIGCLFFLYDFMEGGKRVWWSTNKHLTRPHSQLATFPSFLNPNPFSVFVVSSNGMFHLNFVMSKLYMQSERAYLLLQDIIYVMTKIQNWTLG